LTTPIFEKWEPVLAEKLKALNGALSEVTPELRTMLKTKLIAKERREGKRAITEADERRWLLPEARWEEWEVPFDTDPEWPEPLKAALEDYRKAWRAKMDEVNETIAASAPSETLYDQPKVVPNVLRVSGPFTVEGVQPAEDFLDMESPIGGAPEELETFPTEDEPANAEAYLDKMIHLLRQDGVRFPNNKVLEFERLEPLSNSILHAEGAWGNGEEPRHVAVAFGPQYGPITAKQVEQSLREAYRRGYDDLVFAGFTIDGAAQAVIQEDPDPQVRCHLAHIRPDVNMGDLLKDTPSSQLFTVFGLPRVKLEEAGEGEWIVEMEGVDIYDPVSNTIQATKASKVAAWFLDSDYDGRTFCITQAFFPDSTAWRKLARALKSVVDPQRFAAFSGTRSLPFEAGEHQRIAVKVIDPRGNEVMRVMHLGEVTYG
jgi:adenine-specific DNA-methyltransferase